MCRFFGLSRAAFYAWQKRQWQPDPDQRYLDLVLKAYRASHRTYGYRRIQLWIQGHEGVWINHKAVLRLMNKLGIRSVARRPRPNRYWQQSDNQHRYPNHLARNFHAPRPNRKWVTDITYIRTQQAWSYLVVIKDLYDGFIVGHRFSSRNDVSLVRQAVKDALAREAVAEGLMLHSDQGHQYCSQAYHLLSRQYQFTPSMSRKGNCWDNAPAESFFAQLKEEALRHYPRMSFQQAQRVIEEYIHFYNYERIQLKSKQTPHQLRSLSA
jgi:transposase InsO family protein